MSVTGVGARSSLSVQSLVDMRTPARRSAAPARHRQEVGHLCGPRPRSRPRGRPALAALRDRRAIGDTITQVGVRLDLAQTALGRIAEHRPRREGRDARRQYAIDASGQTTTQTRRAIAARRDARPAQHAGRRPLPVLRPRGRPAGGRDARPHPQRRRRARRPQADHRGAQAGRSRRRAASAGS